MCQQSGCPKRQECYRYLAHPKEHWQVWQSFDPTDTLTCFWPVEGRAVRSVDEVDVALRRDTETPDMFGGEKE